MKIFIIHRSHDKREAKILLKAIGKEHRLNLKLIFLETQMEKNWKDKAELEISSSEMVVIYNPDECEKSENAKWEKHKAIDLKKQILEIPKNHNRGKIVKKIISTYELRKEFKICFKKGKKNTLDLYKLMLESSENLIQRRQKTNAFFITSIGGLLSIAGLLIKTGSITYETAWLTYGFSATGVLLCISWYNLIDNYGKLNKAKFDVILELEKKLSARIYYAEWISLGMGIRKEKYKSFTTTEKNVPVYFGLLIITLTLLVTLNHYYQSFFDLKITK